MCFAQRQDMQKHRLPDQNLLASPLRLVGFPVIQRVRRLEHAPYYVETTEEDVSGWEVSVVGAYTYSKAELCGALGSHGDAVQVLGGSPSSEDMSVNLVEIEERQGLGTAERMLMGRLLGCKDERIVQDLSP